MNTPYGKDIIRLLADACHRRDVPLCLYYSIADWHHPNYPNQGRHHELPPQPGDQPDLVKYLEFLKAQVRELCTNYGEIHGFWWDMNVAKHVDRSINAMIRQLQPKAVINNRGFDEGDFGTPERDYDEGRRRAAELRQAHRGLPVGRHGELGLPQGRGLLHRPAPDAQHRPVPGPRRQLPAQRRPERRRHDPDRSRPPSCERIGKWYHAVKESLEGAMPASHLTSNRNVLLTRTGNTLYVHLHKDPLGEAVKLKPLEHRHSGPRC